MSADDVLLQRSAERAAESKPFKWSLPSSLRSHQRQDFGFNVGDSSSVVIHAAPRPSVRLRSTAVLTLIPLPGGKALGVVLEATVLAAAELGPAEFVVVGMTVGGCAGAVVIVAGMPVSGCAAAAVLVAGVAVFVAAPFSGAAPGTWEGRGPPALGTMGSAWALALAAMIIAPAATRASC